jgi:transcriptional regulator with XRE-family HTH domain
MAMSNISKPVNKTIRIGLVRTGITQKKLAEKAGMHITYFSSRINGHHEWTLADLDGIATALGWNSAVDLLSAAENEQGLAA